MVHDLYSIRQRFQDLLNASIGACSFIKAGSKENLIYSSRIEALRTAIRIVNEYIW